MTDEKNYFYDMIDEVATILIGSENINWPYELTVRQKQTFLKKMIQYYESIESYEKCEQLEKVLESLND